MRPPSGSGGRQPAGDGVGGVSIAAERPRVSLCSAVGNQKLSDGKRHSKKRKAARLETEIGWEVEAEHREEGGEAFQEAPCPGSPPGFSCLQP